ncbi:MAG TPA: SRPBCC family protein [Acidimicrobiales bacterium]
MSTHSTEHGSFVLNRTYPAPPARVFAAWSSRDAKARWFGPADGSMHLQLDFRVGGTEFLQGGPPDGPVHTYEANYREIVPDERIVYDYTMDADGKVISVSVTTVEFAPAGDGTTLTFTEQGVFLDGADTLTLREKGTSELLDQLGDALG